MALLIREKNRLLEENVNFKKAFGKTATFNMVKTKWALELFLVTTKSCEEALNPFQLMCKHKLFAGVTLINVAKCCRG